jgi:hypothetical protein
VIKKLNSASLKMKRSCEDPADASDRKMRRLYAEGCISTDSHCMDDENEDMCGVSRLCYLCNQPILDGNYAYTFGGYRMHNGCFRNGYGELFRILSRIPCTRRNFNSPRIMPTQQHRDMIIAATTGDLPAMKHLLDKGIDPTDDVFGCRPIWHCWMNDPMMILMIYEAGYGEALSSRKCDEICPLDPKNYSEYGDIQPDTIGKQRLKTMRKWVRRWHLD